MQPRSAPPRTFAPLKHKNATPFLWIATGVHRSRRRIREWNKHRALLGFSSATNRGSTTFSARAPLHNDTFALAFNDPFHDPRERKKKLFRSRRCDASHTTRTPSIPIHPSSMLHALARRGCLNGSNAAVLPSNLLSVTKSGKGNGTVRGVYSECRIYQPKEGYGTLDSRGGHF